MSNIATLGLEFQSGSTGGAIAELCKKFDALREKAADAQTAFDKWNTGDTAKNAGDIAAALNQLRPVDSTVASSVTAVVSALFGLEKLKLDNLKKLPDALKPVSDAAVVLSDAAAKVAAIPPDAATGISEIQKVLGNLSAPKEKTLTGWNNFAAVLRNIPAVGGDKYTGIARLAQAVRDFPTIKKKSIDNIGALLKQTATINKINFDGVPALGEMIRSLSGLQLKASAVKNAEKLFATFATLKPIPQDALSSIQTLRDLFAAMAQVSGGGANATNRFNGAMRETATIADTAAAALRTFRSAVPMLILRAATKAAIQFGQELAYISTIATEFNLTEVSEDMLNMPSLLGNATDMANAFYRAYSGGVRGSEEDLKKFVEENAKLAKVIRANLEATTNVTTSLMNAYGMGARDIGHISDILSGIVKYGKASGAQLANSIGQVSPTAATAGLSLEELGAAVSSLTKVMPTRNAITYFNNMLMKMIKPTRAMEQEARKLGIELGLNALRTKGFTAMMEEIRVKTQDSQESLTRLFSDARGQRAALQLLNMGWGDFQQQLKNFQGIAGETDNEMQKLRESIEEQLGSIPTTLNKVAITAGQILISFIEPFKPIIDGFNHMSEGMRKFLAWITLAATGMLAFKAASFAVNTVQAIHVRNNQILGKQNTSLIRQVIALGKADRISAYFTRMKANAQLKQADAARKAARATVANLTALKQDIIEERKLAIAIGDVARAQQLANHYVAISNKLALEKLRLTQANTKASEAQAAADQAAAVANAARNAAQSGSKGMGGAILGMAGMGAFMLGFPKTGFFLEGISMFRSQLGDLANLFVKLAKHGHLLHGVLALLSRGWHALLGILSKIGTVISAILTPLTKLGALFKFTGALATVVGTGVITVFVGLIDIIQSFIRTGDGLKGSFIIQPIANWLYSLFDGTEEITEKERKRIEQEIRTQYAAAREAEKAADRVQSAFLNLFADLVVTPEDEAKKIRDAAKSYNEALGSYNSKVDLSKIKAAGKAEAEARDKYWQRLQEGADKEELEKLKKDYEEKAAATKELEDTAKKRQDAIRNAGLALYNALNEELKVLQENQRFIDQMNEAVYRASYDAATSDVQRIAMIRERAHEFSQQAEKFLEEGNYKDAWAANQKWYALEKQRLSLVGKLAQAEMQANQRMVEFIRSMDKFQSTMVNPTDATSLEARRLESRRFDTMPAFTPMTEQQSATQRLAQALADDMRDFASRVGEKILNGAGPLQAKMDEVKKAIEDVKTKLSGNLTVEVTKMPLKSQRV